MTVTYSHEIANARFCGFTRLLIRWKGSIYKLFWREFSVYMILYSIITAVYRWVLQEQGKTSFEKLCIQFHHYTDSIPIGFVLGFYVTMVVGRWWSQFEYLPFPDQIMMLVGSSIHGTDDRGRMIRRTLGRYLNLSQVLTYRSISTAVWKRFPTDKHLVASGLITSNELYQYHDIKCKHLKYWVPLVWFANLISKVRSEGRIYDDNTYKHVMEELNKYRSSLGMLIGYDWATLPLVYTQVVTWAVYSYFASTLLSRQYLDPNKSYKGHEVDLYFPFFTIFQFIFYMGLLKTAEQLINPFGEDDDDFDVNECIDRNLEVTMIIADRMYQRPPKLEKDRFWNIEFPSLPYLDVSMSHEPFMGSTAEMRVEDPEKYQSHFSLNLKSHKKANSKEVFTVKRSNQLHEALSIDQNMINYWLREEEDHLPPVETSSDDNDLLVTSSKESVDILSSFDANAEAKDPNNNTDEFEKLKDFGSGDVIVDLVAIQTAKVEVENLLKKDSEFKNKDISPLASGTARFNDEDSDCENAKRRENIQTKKRRRIRHEIAMKRIYESQTRHKSKDRIRRRSFSTTKRDNSSLSHENTAEVESVDGSSFSSIASFSASIPSPRQLRFTSNERATSIVSSIPSGNDTTDLSSIASSEHREIMRSRSLLDGSSDQTPFSDDLRKRLQIPPLNVHSSSSKRHLSKQKISDELPVASLHDVLKISENDKIELKKIKAKSRPNSIFRVPKKKELQAMSGNACGAEKTSFWNAIRGRFFDATKRSESSRRKDVEAKVCDASVDEKKLVKKLSDVELFSERIGSLKWEQDQKGEVYPPTDLLKLNDERVLMKIHPVKSCPVELSALRSSRQLFTSPKISFNLEEVDDRLDSSNEDLSNSESKDGISEMSCSLTTGRLHPIPEHESLKLESQIFIVDEVVKS